MDLRYTSTLTASTLTQWTHLEPRCIWIVTMPTTLTVIFDPYFTGERKKSKEGHGRKVTVLDCLSVPLNPLCRNDRGKGTPCFFRLFLFPPRPSIVGEV